MKDTALVHGGYWLSFQSMGGEAAYRTNGEMQAKYQNRSLNNRHGRKLSEANDSEEQTLERADDSKRCAARKNPMTVASDPAAKEARRPTSSRRLRELYGLSFKDTTAPSR